ncbi:MAG: glycoside hydrolase family 3 C-terminal domain-containing protein [Clostridia bacterium]|nr:glycoside hydrolase family 3 C-terminal domain-containing protein [Clostridia bacterium]MBR6524186.1 glycoside hydrolase family 3 C-terminal domain-containing protein [Clostridia bacterium]
MNFQERAKELVSKMTLAEKMSQLQYDSPAITRLNVPAYNWWNECLHGVARSGMATVFPQAIAMAASFDEDLMLDVATAISDEVRAKYNEYKKFGYTGIYQGLTCWSPNINIFRDPRWGRGHETYGEDPYLTARMGTAFIKGLQGDGRYRKTDATIKHYAVHSGPEALRHEFDARVTDKDLYETYLWAFKYCIDNADPSAVMGAYNRTNGEACCASKTLLGDILFGEFGFDGYVVSDCGAICDINNHHKITKNEAESAALAVNNGCHLNCGDAYKWLKTAVALGLINEETITKAAEKLFTARFRLGMFDDDCEYDKIPYDVVECDKHTELSRKMAQESMVLLKNNGILPLKDPKTIAVIGPNADDKSVLLANYNGTPSKYATFLRGIQSASDARVIYAVGCDAVREEVDRWEEHPLNEAIIAAEKADVVILCMGLNPRLEGEESDDYNGGISSDKKDIELPASQRMLTERIVRTGKPIVFVNISGSCTNLSYEKEHCDAVLQCFYPGAEGGNALADILFGKVSPSGRLPVTFYKSIDDIPPFDDYSMENRTYKFYKGEPVFEFGYGLTYSDIEEEWTDENTVQIKNNGEYDVNYSVLKFEYIPHKNLCGFKKVLLKSGETAKVIFE